MRRAVRKVGNQITLPGFRKGKAPRAMIEQMYGPEVFLEEANRFLMTDLYRQALEQEDLVPVGDPRSISARTSHSRSRSSFRSIPRSTWRAISDVRIEPIDAAVDDAAVDEVVESLRKSHSPWVDPQGEGLQVGAGLELTPKSRLSPRRRPGHDRLHRPGGRGERRGAGRGCGLRPRRERAPGADRGCHQGAARRGVDRVLGAVRGGRREHRRIAARQDLSYTVTLKGLKERDLLPLDDDFAKTAGDVDTLDELRSESARGAAPGANARGAARGAGPDHRARSRRARRSSFPRR